VDLNRRLVSVLCLAIDLLQSSIDLSGAGVASSPFFDSHRGRQESLGSEFPLQRLGSEKGSQSIYVALPHRLVGSQAIHLSSFCRRQQSEKGCRICHIRPSLRLYKLPKSIERFPGFACSIFSEIEESLYGFMHLVFYDCLERFHPKGVMKWVTSENLWLL